jgi:hypothetical protein
MTDLEYHQKITEILMKMPCTLEGATQKYRESALFNQVVSSIANGASPYILIDQLIEIIESVQKDYTDHMLKCTRH